MVDPELREILRETLELLKTQVEYIQRLHDSLSAQYDAAVRLDPRLKEYDAEEMQKIRVNDAQELVLRRIQLLLQRIGNLK